MMDNSFCYYVNKTLKEVANCGNFVLLACLQNLHNRYLILFSCFSFQFKFLNIKNFCNLSTPKILLMGMKHCAQQFLCKNHSVWKTFGDLIPSLIFESFWSNWLLKYFQLLHYILLTNAHFKYTIWYTISAKTLSFFVYGAHVHQSLRKTHEKLCTTISNSFSLGYVFSTL